MNRMALFERLRKRVDKENRVNLLLSSKDPNLSDYFNAIGSAGSTHMEEDGKIYVKIHDAGGASFPTWLEEMAHAQQFLSQGHVPFSCDHLDRRQRELEVANCILGRADASRLQLNEIDRAHYTNARIVYRVDDVRN